MGADMDKMREEFEIEMLASGYEQGEFLPDDETGGYRDQELVAMWIGWKLGWKASRAALCVELPPQWFSRSDDEEVMSAIGVIDALNCQGVRHE